MWVSAGRLGVLFASTLVVVIAFGGCGDDSAEHLRKLGEYTSANVADELLARFRNLDQVQEKTNERIRNGEDDAKGVGDQKKGARSGSPFDQLITDIASKAARVQPDPPAAVFDQISQKVDADGSVAEKDRQRIKDALKSAMHLGEPK